MAENRLEGYVALVLTSKSQQALLDLAEHEVAYCHHVTLAYRPTPEEYAFYEGLLDYAYDFNVVGYKSDSQGQAVAVELPCGMECKNSTPHVTVSCALGVKPVYSNRLLESGYEDYSMPLQGRLVFVSFSKK